MENEEEPDEKEQKREVWFVRSNKHDVKHNFQK